MSLAISTKKIRKLNHGGGRHYNECHSVMIMLCSVIVMFYDVFVECDDVTV